VTASAAAPQSGRGLSLTGARVVITGAGGGIGAALASALAAQDARLLLTDLDADRVAAVAADLEVPHVAGDVTDADDVRTLVETANAVLGGVQNIVNYGRPDDYYERLGGKYQAMTASALDSAGRTRLDPDKLVFVVVGDASVVKPQLESLGLAVEVIPAPAIN